MENRGVHLSSLAGFLRKRTKLTVYTTLGMAFTVAFVSQAYRVYLGKNADIRRDTPIGKLVVDPKKPGWLELGRSLRYRWSDGGQTGVDSQTIRIIEDDAGEWTLGGGYKPKKQGPPATK